MNNEEDSSCTCEETSEVINDIVGEFDDLQEFIIDYLKSVRFVEKMQAGKCCTSQYALHCILKNLFAIQLSIQNREIEVLDDLQKISDDYIRKHNDIELCNATIH